MKAFYNAIMLRDPDFITRARLWAALFDLIPEEHEAEGARIAAELHGAYFSAIEFNGSLCDEARAELRKATRELEEVKALAAAPIRSSH